MVLTGSLIALSEEQGRNWLASKQERLEVVTIMWRRWFRTESPDLKSLVSDKEETS